MNSFFAGVVLPPSDKPVLKIPSKLKEAIKSAKEQMEKRLKEEQKIVSQLSLTPLLIFWISSACNYCYHLSLLLQKHIKRFQFLYLTVFRIFCLGLIIRHTYFQTSELNTNKSKLKIKLSVFLSASSPNYFTWLCYLNLVIFLKDKSIEEVV